MPMYIHTHKYIISSRPRYIYTYMYLFVCVCVQDTEVYMEVWISLMDKNTCLIPVKDAAQEKFDQLLMGLDSRGCTLGFDKGDAEKYKAAKQLIRGQKTLNHRKMIVILLAVREKARPVTIIDYLRRRQVLLMCC